MASNQEKFAKDIVDRALKIQSEALGMFNVISGLSDDFLKNMKGEDALKNDILLKKSKAFENLNKAKKDLENLMRGK